MKSTEDIPEPIDYFSKICPANQRDYDLKSAMNVCMHVILYSTDHALRFKAIDVVRDAWADIHGNPRPDYSRLEFAQTLEMIFGTERKRKAHELIMDGVWEELRKDSHGYL